MASFAVEDFGGLNELNRKGIDMAKKQKSKSRGDVSAYFPIQLAMQTNEELKNQFAVAVSLLNARGSLQMLDQKKMSNQTTINLLMLWLGRTIEKKGVKWVEKEMGPVMDELSGIVAAEMKTRGREIDPTYLPEGFSLMKEGKKGRSRQENEDSTDAE